MTADAPLVERLAEHRLTTPVQCACGWRETDPDAGTHAEHVATALLPVVEQAVAEARGEAWDEGYLRGTLDTTSDLEPADNPYRGDGIGTTEGA